MRISCWITAMRAEIASRDFPGERLICCRSPVLAEERAGVVAACEDLR